MALRLRVLRIQHYKSTAYTYVLSYLVHELIISIQRAMYSMYVVILLRVTTRISRKGAAVHPRTEGSLTTACMHGSTVSKIVI